MNCNFCQERLELYILGELDPSVARGISDHLESGCEACDAEMRAFSESLECLIESTETISPRGPTWDLIAAAIESDQSPLMGSTVLKAPAPSTDSTFRPILLGLLATACGFVITMLTLRAFIDRTIPTSALVDERVASGVGGSIPEPSDWAVDSASRDQDESSSQLVSFHEPNQSRHIAGAMVVDVHSAQIHVHVQMNEPRDYSLWFITKGNQWIFGGELERLVDDFYGSVLDIPKTDEPIVYAVITIGQADDVNSAGRDVALVSDSVSGLSHWSL